MRILFVRGRGLVLFLMFFGIANEISYAEDNKIHPPLNIYSNFALDQREAELKRIAASLPQYDFSLLRVGNTTPAAWVVKNKEGKPIALLKCTAGNNFSHAEVASYYLGRLLALPIYPVTIGINIDQALANKLKTVPQYCALKEWYQNWAIFYWKAQANIKKMVRANKYNQYKVKNSFLSSKGDNKLLADTLLCQNDLSAVKNKYIQLSSGKKTKNGDPLIRPGQPTLFVSDKISLIDVAKDFSNMMVIDAITGNGDRFPGENLKFRSSVNRSILLKNQHVIILSSRLSSLDTGFSFKGWQPTWARLEMGYYLRRFDPAMLQRLKALLNELDHLTPADLKGKWSFLNFNTQMNSRITAVDYLKTNITWVLKFVEQVSNKKNKEIIPGKKSGCEQIYF